MALARHKHHSVLRRSQWQESKGFTSGGVWLEGFELRDDCKTMLQMTMPLYRYRLECVQHETCKYKLDEYLHPCNYGLQNHTVNGHSVCNRRMRGGFHRSDDIAATKKETDMGRL